MRGIDAYHCDVTVREAFTRLIIKDNEIVPDGLLALNLRVHAHPDRRATPDRF